MVQHGKKFSSYYSLALLLGAQHHQKRVFVSLETSIGDGGTSIKKISIGLYDSSTPNNSSPNGKNADGSVSLILTPEGKRQATLGQFLGLKIKKLKRWDKLWRIVLFDIPEKHRHFRDIFRSHLKAIGFHELQHSVFVFPFPCEKEILSLVKLYHATAHVRFIEAHHIDNEKALKKKFSLP